MSRKLPPFSAVKAFEAAARHGSFARAAQELDVTSTAISQHVKGLEQWLGEALFVRRANRVALTSAGERILPDTSRLLDEMAALIPPKPSDEDLVALHIALPASLSEGWLLPNLYRFYEAHPQVEIVIRDAIKRPTHQDFATIDFLITDREIEEVDLLSDLLFDDQIEPVCSAQYRDLLGLQDPHNWKSVTLLHDTHFESDWALWADAHSTFSMDCRGGLRYPNHWLAIEAAKQGRGLLIAHRALVRDALEEGSLVSLATRPFSTSRRVSLIRRRGHMNPAAIQFRSWIIGSLGKK